MFTRMIIRAAVLRRRRAAAALLAMIVAAAVATAMLNLYVDVQAKLRTEFRNYGANVVVVAKEGQSLPADALGTIQAALGPKTLAVPFSYAVARTPNGQSVVVVGTDFARARQLNHWWNVSHWPAPQIAAHLESGSAAPPIASQALLGVRAAPVVTRNREPFDLSFQGRTIRLEPSAMLQTGAAEDSRIYIAQADFENWTGIKPTTIEVAATGTSFDVDASIRQLTQLFPTADVRPVRQIMAAEANVLDKTRATLLASATLVILTAALCVLSTLMGWVFDRRRDFAMMKVLGASELLLNAFFAAEAAALGVVGSVLGFFLGIGAAAWIGRANFHAPVVPRFAVFPYVLAGSVLVAILAAAFPITVLRRIQPAMILRGE
jgi:putative ABC transport system permease protein